MGRLILSRNVGETICVGDDVEITISTIRGNQAKLLIDAPNEVAVDRKEIRKKKEIDKPDA